MPPPATRNRSKSTMEDLPLYLVDALKDEQVAASLERIFRRSTESLEGSIKELQNAVVTLRNELKIRDNDISELKKENSLLKIKMDDQEQYTR